MNINSFDVRCIYEFTERYLIIITSLHQNKDKQIFPLKQCFNKWPPGTLRYKF